MILRKQRCGRGPSCPPNFWSLEKGTRTFMSVKSPIPLLYLRWVDMITLGKNKQVNAHPWFFFWQKKKIQNSVFLQIGGWNLCCVFLWYAESDGVISDSMTFRVCLLLFVKPGKFSKARNCMYLEHYIFFQNIEEK